MRSLRNIVSLASPSPMNKTSVPRDPLLLNPLWVSTKQELWKNLLSEEDLKEKG
uniref:Uncharacterized protein n=1 Tax=Brassica campestris TaxID=3711 RepID=A0A3P5Z3L1_BRACM|nr:unnamed protein product [Brassica rapa]